MLKSCNRWQLVITDWWLVTAINNHHWMLMIIHRFWTSQHKWVWIIINDSWSSMIVDCHSQMWMSSTSVDFINKCRSSSTCIVCLQCVLFVNVDCHQWLLFTWWQLMMIDDNWGQLMSNVDNWWWLMSNFWVSIMYVCTYIYTMLVVKLLLRPKSL